MPYFPARLDFPSPPLSAPGSPRMTGTLLQTMSCVATEMKRTLVLLSNGLIMVKITRNIDLPCVAVIILYWMSFWETTIRGADRQMNLQGQVFLELTYRDF